MVHNINRHDKHFFFLKLNLQNSENSPYIVYVVYSFSLYIMGCGAGEWVGDGMERGEKRIFVGI